MRIETVELLPLRLPLRTPWHTAGGVMPERDVLLVHVRTDGGEGWGECAAFATPFYSPEFVASAQIVLRDRLAPLLMAVGEVSAATVGAHLSPIVGHRMAKSALEMAVLDAELRAAGRSFASYLGVTRDCVDAGIAIGLAESPAELCDTVAGYAALGYHRVKLKVEPGRDLAHVAAVREQFPALSLQVDANGAYHRDDADHLAALDDLALTLIEQPLAADDLVGHALLADRLRTPICLDEPLVSLAATETAVALGACEVVNLKPGRVGGYLEARRIHDWCVDRGIPLWCGGMLETGLGRAANVALAALDGFTVTGDLSPGARFYEHDVVVDPITMDGGTLAVPDGPGFGVEVDRDAVERFRIS